MMAQCSSNENAFTVNSEWDASLTWLNVTRALYVSAIPMEYRLGSARASCARPLSPMETMVWVLPEPSSAHMMPWHTSSYPVAHRTKQYMTASLYFGNSKKRSLTTSCELNHGLGVLGNARVETCSTNKYQIPPRTPERSQSTGFGFSRTSAKTLVRCHSQCQVLIDGDSCEGAKRKLYGK